MAVITNIQINITHKYFLKNAYTQKIKKQHYWASMYFFNCSSETRCKYFFGMMHFFKKLISSFYVSDFISFCSILVIAAISSCFKKCKSSSVLTL